jgi:hypothetical protein
VVMVVVFNGGIVVRRSTFWAVNYGNLLAWWKVRQLKFGDRRISGIVPKVYSLTPLMTRIIKILFLGPSDKSSLSY